MRRCVSQPFTGPLTAACSVELRRRRPQRRVERIAVGVAGQHARVDVDRVLLDVAPDAGFVARLVRVLVGHAQLRAADAHRRAGAGLVGEVGERAHDALRQLLRVARVEILAAAVDGRMPQVVDRLRSAGAGRGGPVGRAGRDGVDAVRIADRAAGADRQAVGVDVLPRRDGVLHLVGDGGAQVADPVVHREIGEAVAGRGRALVDTAAGSCAPGVNPVAPGRLASAGTVWSSLPRDAYDKRRVPVAVGRQQVEVRLALSGHGIERIRRARQARAREIAGEELADAPHRVRQRRAAVRGSTL